MKETRFNHGHRWTDDEIKTLMRLWAAGETSHEISAVMPGITANAVFKMVVRLRQQGIPLARHRQGHQKGERAGKPWTQDEVAFLARRRIEKATSEQIGLELGRTHIAVTAMIAKLRSEGVPIAMRGHGVRRLYDLDALRRSLIISEPENTTVIRLDEAESSPQQEDAG